MRNNLPQLLLAVALTIITLFVQNADAASLTLTWADNSDNEDGFNIERKAGDNGSYTSIANVAPNTTSFTDSGLADSTTYCYRVNAFNSAGNSPYSPEVCGTTPAAPVTTPTLTLTVSVQGSGTVLSNPAGINCGSSCSATFASGTPINLSAVAANGYSFSAWSGDPDCLDGSITLSTNKTCTATFVRNSVSTATLTVSVVGTVSNGGTGKGSVVSTPAGINCGGSCTASFPVGSTVSLTATAAAGSVFSGWSGDADCLDGVVTLGASKACNATFTARGNQLNVFFRGKGRGHVLGNPGSLDCVTDCSATFTAPTRVALRVIPALGSTFTGWSGDPACSKGVVAVNGSATCTANFDQRPASIGLFDTTTREWRLKSALASANNGCNIDACYQWQKKNLSGLGSQWIPVVGDWNTSGTDDLGIYSASESSTKGSRWYLDRNGNDKWNGCDRDQCLRSFGQRGDLPVVGDWNGTGKAKIGVFRPSTAEWLLDLDGNGKFDGCAIDRCMVFGLSGDLPVAGDWDGSGVSKIGVFRPSTGDWFLDFNGNGQWDGWNVDMSIASFGQSGDLPVVGDWDASGTSKIGVFRPSTGDWFLDMNGNGQWDGASTDKYISGFGRPGDLPVAGKW